MKISTFIREKIANFQKTIWEKISFLAQNCTDEQKLQLLKKMEAYEKRSKLKQIEDRKIRIPFLF